MLIVVLTLDMVARREAVFDVLTTATVDPVVLRV